MSRVKLVTRVSVVASADRDALAGTDFGSPGTFSRGSGQRSSGRRPATTIAGGGATRFAERRPRTGVGRHVTLKGTNSLGGRKKEKTLTPSGSTRPCLS